MSEEMSELVLQATDPVLSSPDLAKNLEIVDIVNGSGLERAARSKALVWAVHDRLWRKKRDSTVVYLCTELINFLLLNCSTVAHFFGKPDFQKTVYKVAKSKLEESLGKLL